jgi:hypothetical protein
MHHNPNSGCCLKTPAESAIRRFTRKSYCKPISPADQRLPLLMQSHHTSYTELSSRHNSSTELRHSLHIHVRKPSSILLNHFQNSRLPICTIPNNSSPTESTESKKTVRNTAIPFLTGNSQGYPPSNLLFMSSLRSLSWPWSRHCRISQQCQIS